MDRRQFLLASSSALAAATASPSALLAACPNAQQAWSLAVSGADQLMWTAIEANSFARRLEEASSASRTVHVVDAHTNPDALFTLATASELVEIDQGFAFATGLPGRNALDATALNTWMTHGGGQQALDELAAVHGLKVILVAHSGPSLLWSKTPVNQSQDLAGGVVHADGLARSVAAGLGAEPWRILAGHPSAAFATGELIAVEASIPAAMSGQILQQARFAMENALAPHGTVAVLKISLSAWQAMPAAQRAWIEQTAQAHYRDSAALNGTYAAMNRDALVQAFGINAAPVAPKFAANIQIVTRAMIAQAAASSPSAGKLNASYMSFLLNPLNSNGESTHV